MKKKEREALDWRKHGFTRQKKIWSGILRGVVKGGRRRKEIEGKNIH